MYDRVDTRHPTEVEVEVTRLYRAMFPAGDRAMIPRVFDWATACFTGNYEGLQPLDTKYHDYEHTLQVTLCLTRLLHARHQAGAQPVLGLTRFEQALIAALFHDSGYLKTKYDNFGSGAKFTVIHVERGAEFAGMFLTEQGYPLAAIKAVQNMILCTNFMADLGRIPFTDEEERMAGLALATADLLGQMADPEYVEKLPRLFSEFREADYFKPPGEAGKDTTAFSSAKDLMRKTPLFYEKVVKVKINRDYRGLYRYLNLPYPEGPNWYMDQIEANLKRLEEMLAQQTDKP
jgi:hypothetical protein